MMKTYVGSLPVIRIEGNPVPQPRGRTFAKNGVTRTLSNPKRVKAWKDLIILQARCQWHRSPFPEGVFLRVGFRFRVQRPKSKPKYQYPCRSDLDNFIKAAQDALNGIIWYDDRFIIGYLEPTEKVYDDNPGVEIRIVVEKN